MMHQGLDLSRFKKVSSDNKTTTLQHAKGHEIKIAHSGITPKMKEQLAALPMAEGGKVKLYADSDEPVAADDSAPTVGAQPMDPASPAQADDTPDSVTDMKQALAEANAGAGANPLHPVSYTPDEQPEAEPEEQEQPAPTPSLPQLTQDDALWAQDQRNGHITPQTYQSLFAKKDTLGKIGTLFGLLVSGAGSGLAHQPNAVMEMMNRQIQNDLEAQKASKSNVQNYYNTALHLMQGIPNAEKAAAEAAISKMRVSFWQHLTNTNDKMPPSATQQTGSALLQALFPQVQAANAQNNAKAVMAMHENTGDPNTFSGPVNNDVLATGNFLDPQTFGPAYQEGKHVAKTRMLYENYLKSWNRLNTLTAGQTPEMLALASKAAAGYIPLEGLNPAVSELAKKLMGERQSQIDSLPGVPESFLPSGFDFTEGGGNAEGRNARRRNAANWFDLQEGPTPNLDMINKRYNVVKPRPYDNYVSQPNKAPAKKPASKPKEEQGSSGKYQGLVDALQKKNEKMAK